MSDSETSKMVRDFTEKVEAVEAEIAELNIGKSTLFKDAKNSGLDVKTLRAVISHRRKRDKNPTEFAVSEATFAEYLGFADGVVAATRAPAREEGAGETDEADEGILSEAVETTDVMEPTPDDQENPVAIDGTVEEETVQTPESEASRIDDLLDDLNLDEAA